MTNKGFEAEINLEETPNLNGTDDKPFKNRNNSRTQKVDINVLKARVQATQNKENKKNILIFSVFLIILGVLGVFLSA